ncbi:hypothetical protein VKT23_000502 [Stygiomarasmius scandens]|uniref:Gag-like protein n=1 Tax=Marasmiellus scandens TaxID=2682957 RepID=A0ABR1K5H8_9AGAR
MSPTFHKRTDSTGLSRPTRNIHKAKFNPIGAASRHAEKKNPDNNTQKTPSTTRPVGFAAGDKTMLSDSEHEMTDTEDNMIRTPRQQRHRTDAYEAEYNNAIENLTKIAASLENTTYTLHRICPEGTSNEATEIAEHMIDFITENLGIKPHYASQLDTLLKVTSTLISEVQTLSNEISLHREQSNKMMSEIIAQRTIINKLQSQPKTPTTTTTHTTQNTYADKVAQGHRNTPPNPKQDNLIRREEERKTRLVAYFNPGIPPEQRRSNFDIVRDINKILTDTPGTDELRVASVGWSQRGNAILATLPGQLASRLEEFAFRFNHVYTTDNTTRPTDSAPDEHWCKIAVHAVNTGIKHAHVLNGGTPRLWSTEELLQQMQLLNPQLTENKITIKMGPRFMAPPGDVMHKDESSIVFAVANQIQADYIIRQLRAINMFGKKCRVQEYTERPPNKPCTNCQAFGHAATNCRNTRICCLCGGNHTEISHILTCEQCNKKAEQLNLHLDEDSIRKGAIPTCTHDLKCDHRHEQQPNLTIIMDPTSIKSKRGDGPHSPPH